MIGKYAMFKNGFVIDDAFSCIQIKETHEVGEIINNYQLILNNIYDEKFIYNAGELVKIIDVRFLDEFETDMNYDRRKDFIKLGMFKTRGYDKECHVNTYGYISK